MSEPGTTARALLRTLSRDLRLEDIDALQTNELTELRALTDHWQQLLLLRLEMRRIRAAAPKRGCLD